MTFKVLLFTCSRTGEGVAGEAASDDLFSNMEKLRFGEGGVTPDVVALSSRQVFRSGVAKDSSTLIELLLAPGKSKTSGRLK